MEVWVHRFTELYYHEDFIDDIRDSVEINSWVPYVQTSIVWPRDEQISMIYTLCKAIYLFEVRLQPKYLSLIYRQCITFSTPQTHLETLSLTS